MTIRRIGDLDLVKIWLTGDGAKACDFLSSEGDLVITIRMRIVESLEISWIHSVLVLCVSASQMVEFISHEGLSGRVFPMCYALRWVQSNRIVESFVRMSKHVWSLVKGLNPPNVYTDT